MKKIRPNLLCSFFFFFKHALSVFIRVAGLIYSSLDGVSFTIHLEWTLCLSLLSNYMGLFGFHKIWPVSSFCLSNVELVESSYGNDATKTTTIKMVLPPK